MVLLAAALLLAGCAQQKDTNNSADANIQVPNNVNTGSGVVKTVEQGDTVKVEYVGTFPDTKEIFDKSEGRGPLEFEAGAGQMIKGFDQGVIGMKLNDEKTITIAPEDAYGAADSGQKAVIPLGTISADGNLQVGQTLYSSTGLPAKVIEIKDGNVTVLIQHPLAGKTLQFWIKVVDIQKKEQ